MLKVKRPDIPMSGSERNITGVIFCGSVLLFTVVQPANAQEKSKLEWSSDLEASYGYDSNVSVDDVDFSISQGDQFANFKVGGRMELDRGDEEYTASLSVSEKLYDTFDEFDGRLTLARGSAEKKVGRYTLDMTGRYIDYRLDNEAFIDMYQLAPSISWFPTKRVFLRFAYQYSDESFDRNSGRDNDRHEFGGTAYYFMNGIRQYVSARLQYAEEGADDDEFSNDEVRFRLAYHQRFKMFGKEARLKLAYRYLTRDFDDIINPEIGEKRDDDRHRYEIELEVPINEAFSVSLDLVSNDNQSNLPSADYRHEVYQIGVKYEF